MTGAPFVMKDQKSGKRLLVHGSSGDEFGVVGWLFARDPDTGEEVWARPMVEGHMGRLNGKDSTPTGDPKAPSWPDDPRTAPARSRPGATAAARPGRPLRSTSRQNMVVIGTGNPAPWNTWKRTKEGDDPRNWPSLFTSGQAYVDASDRRAEGLLLAHAQRRLGLLRQQLGAAVRVQGSEDRQAWSRPRPTPTATASSS
jgi:glucose dehydrogenase